MFNRSLIGRLMYNESKRLIPASISMTLIATFTSSGTKVVDGALNTTGTLSVTFFPDFLSVWIGRCFFTATASVIHSADLSMDNALDSSFEPLRIRQGPLMNINMFSESDRVGSYLASGETAIEGILITTLDANNIAGGMMEMTGAADMSSQALVYSWDQYPSPGELNWTEEEGAGSVWTDVQPAATLTWRKGEGT